MNIHQCYCHICTFSHIYTPCDESVERPWEMGVCKRPTHTHTRTHARTHTHTHKHTNTHTHTHTMHGMSHRHSRIHTIHVLWPPYLITPCSTLSRPLGSRASSAATAASRGPSRLSHQGLGLGFRPACSKEGVRGKGLGLGFRPACSKEGVRGKRLGLGFRPACSKEGVWG